ncbi:hypothetical protein YWIDRAFT_07549 [Streptomyces sp. SceaMP-e96]|nr:hypothetical protein YWIDRAFT_07549 [Streptomyces sp. SceaMP-e96]
MASRSPTDHLEQPNSAYPAPYTDHRPPHHIGHGLSQRNDVSSMGLPTAPGPFNRGTKPRAARHATAALRLLHRKPAPPTFQVTSAPASNCPVGEGCLFGGLLRGTARFWPRTFDGRAAVSGQVGDDERCGLLRSLCLAQEFGVAGGVHLVRRGASDERQIVAPREVGVAVKGEAAVTEEREQLAQAWLGRRSFNRPRTAASTCVRVALQQQAPGLLDHGFRTHVVDHGEQCVPEQPSAVSTITFTNAPARPAIDRSRCS